LMQGVRPTLQNFNTFHGGLTMSLSVKSALRRQSLPLGVIYH
jgi:hypothetical protein